MTTPDTPGTPDGPYTPRTPRIPLTDAQAESLTAPSEPWLSCDDCFDRIDTSVEALLQDGRALDEPMRVHLTRCPACHDEAESLVCLIAGGMGTSPTRALDAFRTGLGAAAGARPERRSVLERLFRHHRTAG